jgi:2-polyprenyl-6-methoxyphenol hydroxylase-like FAD-dependent oxidoreductase
MRILISGAGIAGTTLAWWLCRDGHDVFLVEKAPRLRTGGYVIDFWGLGYDVAEKMGLRESLHARGYAINELRFLDHRGRIRSGIRTDALRDTLDGRFTSIRRSDLAALVFDALPEGLVTLFGDSVTDLEERSGGVQARFEQAPPLSVDLVIGADGLHSRVRALAFAEAGTPEIGLGYHVAAFEASGYRPRDELVYVTHGIAGRQVSRLALRDDVTLFLLVVDDDHLPAARLDDHASQKTALRRAFRDVEWECPRILDVMEDASELYFDRVSQIRLPRWTCGRIALIGDAAAAVSLLAGEGTGLAMAEAYVLAGELQVARDPGVAFERYEARLQPFLRRKQIAACRFAASFAPRSALGIKVRDLLAHLLRVPWLARRLVSQTLRDDLRLPEYPPLKLR